MSNSDYLAKQRVRRKSNGNKATKKYEKTKNGFIMRVYRNMKSRVTGIQKLKAHIYVGLPLLSKEEFYAWALADETFNKLFEDWTNNAYNRKLTPSIDRIDSTKGYEKDNIRWLTHSQNSALGNQSRFSSPISTLVPVRSTSPRRRSAKQSIKQTA